MGEATTLLREFDFKKASVPEKLLVIKIQQAVIDKGLSDAAERFTTIEPVQDGIRPGDIVRISYPDDTAETGTRTAQFSVGRCFFDPQLENALLGMKQGESAELTVKGLAKQVEICSVKRRNIPALTDKAVASIGIPGVETIDAYRQRLIDQAVQRNRMQRDHILTDFVQKQVLAQSEFTPVDRTAEEFVDFYERIRFQARQMAEQQEDISEMDMLRRMTGQKQGASDQEILVALAEECEREMKLLAIGRAHAARDGVVYTLADCEQELRKFADMRGISYEEMLAQYTPESLLPSKYTQYYASEILAHYTPQYTVAIE